MKDKSKYSRIDIPWAEPSFYGKERRFLIDAFDSGWLSEGYYVKRFEEEFSHYHHAAYGLTTSNGTSSLFLSLIGLGIGRGDEVIVPGFCFASAVNMVIAVGAKPVYADIDPQTWCISPEEIKRCISPKTKAVLVVHTYGNVCDMESIIKIVKEYNIYLIEDAAEAAFSRCGLRYAGSFGDAGCFSFHASKTIVMGEGGAIITNSSELYERIRLIRDHGRSRDRYYWHEAIGYNFRLTNLQAAIGCGQLENAEKIVSERQRIWGLYSKLLKGEEGIELQYFSSEVTPVVWSTAVKIREDVFKLDRDMVIKKLLEAGIETRPGFCAFSMMPLYNAPPLPVSERISTNVISLPSYISLSDEQIYFICDTLKQLRQV